MKSALSAMNASHDNYSAAAAYPYANPMAAAASWGPTVAAASYHSVTSDYSRLAQGVTAEYNNAINNAINSQVAHAAAASSLTDYSRAAAATAAWGVAAAGGHAAAAVHQDPWAASFDGRFQRVSDACVYNAAKQFSQASGTPFYPWMGIVGEFMTGYISEFSNNY